MKKVLLYKLNHVCDCKKEYGEDIWQNILERTSYPTTVFCTHQIYPDVSLNALIFISSKEFLKFLLGVFKLCRMKILVVEFCNAAVEVLGNGSSSEDVLNYFGRCFVRSFDRYGYDKIIKVG